MLEGIEALVALEQLGTISEAAVRLRLTQSAVSKRLKALEDAVGFPLLAPDGRRVRLTPRGLDFVQRARPLMAELRALTRPVEGPSIASLSLALSDSLASSWGPEVVSRAIAALPGLRVDLHAHRSVLVIESVRLGRYHAGLCTAPPAAKDLIQHEIVAEPLVLVHAGLGARADRRRPLITIEPTSATWRAVEPLLRQHHPDLLDGRLLPVESFGAALQMVKAGFGDGVVPLGLVMETRLPRRAYRALEGVERRIALCTRKTVDQLPSFCALRERLIAAAEAHFRRVGRGALDHGNRIWSACPGVWKAQTRTGTRVHACYRGGVDPAFPMLMIVALAAVGCGGATARPGAGSALCKDGDLADCTARCAKGEAGSCNVLGMMLVEGRGTPADGKRARAAFERGCDEKNPRACSNLGLLLMTGALVPRDLRAALAAYERGCEGGLPGACANVGALCMKGQGGVAIDYARAVAASTKACDAGDALGCANLGVAYLKAWASLAIRRVP